MAPYGQWVHLAAVYDGSEVSMYVDSVLRETTPLSGKSPYSNYKVTTSTCYATGVTFVSISVSTGKISNVCKDSGTFRFYSIQNLESMFDTTVWPVSMSRTSGI